MPLTISPDIETAHQKRATFVVRWRGGPSQVMRNLRGAVRPYLETAAFVALCLAITIAASAIADWGWPP